MSDEIQIAGVGYVSSKRAAQISGYTQDYIGQLCRAGLIHAERIGGLWYLTLDSLYKYKQKADSYVPVAPRKETVPQTESLISFAGKDYISATRAAEITGYHHDYIGQLARHGTVLSRQAGNRWYIERDGLLAHKKEKDALLAAVQAEAVGIRRADRENQPRERGDGDRNAWQPHFVYSPENQPLLPFVEAAKQHASYAVSSAGQGRHVIPIRVHAQKERAPHSPDVSHSHKKRPKTPSYGTMASVALTIVIVITFGYVSLKTNAVYTWGKSAPGETLTASVSESFDSFAALLEKLLTVELVYQRRR